MEKGHRHLKSVSIPSELDQHKLQYIIEDWLHLSMVARSLHLAVLSFDSGFGETLASNDPGTLRSPNSD